MAMRIVFVCTTNVWGSAMAELISRQLLAEWDPNREKVEVYSVGVRAEVGAPMPAVVQQVLAERGIDASQHRARWMSPDVLAGADLTLTMGAIQREAALALNPRGLRSTFTLREATALLRSPARMTEATAADRSSRRLIAELADARRFRSVPVGHDDLPDLLTEHAEGLRSMAEQLSRDVSELLWKLVPFESPSTLSPMRAAEFPTAPAVQGICIVVNHGVDLPVCS